MTKKIKNCYVGIDVAKNSLDLFISSSNQYLQFPNDLKGWKIIIKKIKKLPLSLVTMESTGGYEKPLAQALAKANLPVAVINPRQLRDFAKSLGILAKTDRIDAKVIATFSEATKPTPNVVYDENQNNLEELNTRRRQLVDMITAEKNRLDKVSYNTQLSINRVISSLEKELQDINNNISSSISNNEEFLRKDSLLQTIKGVGQITSRALIADLPELGSLSAKQITSLAGLAPFNRDSGKMRGQRAIWGGRAKARTSLFMATLVAVKYNSQIKTFYLKLCSLGKAKKIAIIACMHKLLIIMNAMLKHNQPWAFNF